MGCLCGSDGAGWGESFGCCKWSGVVSAPRVVSTVPAFGDVRLIRD